MTDLTRAPGIVVERTRPVAFRVQTSGSAAPQRRPTSRDAAPGAGAPQGSLAPSAAGKKERPMTMRVRLVLAATAVLLVAVYVLPIWKIELEAPQYPEGIGMYITLDSIEGMKPNDLQNINGLNHYIGMARIEPELFPELRLMPWILGALILTGLVTASMGSRRLLLAWTAAFLVAAGAGMIDFYVWGYQYGRNLDPRAAIKVPGLSYQPPLIGSKKLLNFTAHSWPAPGGWIAIVAGATLVLVAASELRGARRPGAPMPRTAREGEVRA
jgi:hypothetical protein